MTFRFLWLQGRLKTMLGVGVCRAESCVPESIHSGSGCSSLASTCASDTQKGDWWDSKFLALVWLNPGLWGYLSSKTAERSVFPSKFINDHFIHAEIEACQSLLAVWLGENHRIHLIFSSQFMVLEYTTPSIL